MRKKKKIRKRKSSNLKKSISKFDLQLEKDGKKFWKNFNPKPVKVNVHEKAKYIKTWNELRHILEAYAPGVAYPSKAALIILRHVNENWNYYQIFCNPDNYGAIVKLVNFTTKVGAKKAYKSQHLKVFCRWTGYKKPETYKTFQNHMTEFKEFLGVKIKYNERIKESAADIAYEKEMQKKLKDPEFWRFGKKI